jgi:mycothiol synthase
VSISASLDGLPDGLTTRPRTLADAETVAALQARCERHIGGDAEATTEDILSGWEHPGVDLDEDGILVFDGNRLVAYAEWGAQRAEADVDPDDCGRGIGSALLEWTELRAFERAAPTDEVRAGQTINDRATDAVELLRSNGYGEAHRSWVLKLPREVRIEHPPLPDGTTIRPFDPATEEQAVYRVIEDAFNEWPDRRSATFEEWRAISTARRDFDPALLLVAVDRGEVVGAAMGLEYPDEGWIEQIAVRMDHRGLGLGKALLRALFEGHRDKGMQSVGLSTDSRTGALDLYLHVGMVVTSTYTRWTKQLRPAG